MGTLEGAELGCRGAPASTRTSSARHTDTVKVAGIVFRTTADCFFKRFI